MIQRIDPGSDPVGHGDGSAHERKRSIESWDLFRGGREVLILHLGQEYRLMITRNGKLILNK